MALYHLFYPSMLQYAARSYGTGHCRLTCYFCIIMLSTYCVFINEMSNLLQTVVKNKNEIKGTF